MHGYTTYLKSILWPVWFEFFWLVFPKIDATGILWFPHSTINQQWLNYHEDRVQYLYEALVMIVSASLITVMIDYNMVWNFLDDNENIMTKSCNNFRQKYPF